MASMIGVVVKLLMKRRESNEEPVVNSRNFSDQCFEDTICEMDANFFKQESRSGNHRTD